MQYLRSIPNALIALALQLIGGPAAAEPRVAAAVPVELELVLAVDISASVDDAEFRLQMDGLAGAFRDPAVVAAIRAQGSGGIAVTLVQWSATARQMIAWTRVRDRATAAAFARLIAALPRSPIGRTTAIGSAIRTSVGLFADNGFDGRRRSIDVSGDGQNNSGHPIWVERKAAVAAGVTINGLAILDGDSRLESYYQSHVIGGTGAFVVTARGFADFARAIRLKLLREINPVVARGRQDPPVTHGHHAGLEPR